MTEKQQNNFYDSFSIIFFVTYVQTNKSHTTTQIPLCGFLVNQFEHNQKIKRTKKQKEPKIIHSQRKSIKIPYRKAIPLKKSVIILTICVIRVPSPMTDKTKELKKSKNK